MRFIKLVCNSLLVSVTALYLLKAPGKFWFSGVFGGYKMGTLARDTLMKNTGKNSGKHLTKGKQWH